MPTKDTDDLFDHVIEAKIQDLIPDNLNANQGTERGDYLLSQSMQKLGAGRSVLLDKKGRVIAGNKTVAKFGEVGLEDVVIVRTDGKKLVAVQRTDLDLDSPQGREMALADNRVSEVNLSWDTEALAEIGQEVDLGDWFTDEEIAGWDVDLDDFDPPSDEEDEEATADLIEQAEEGGIESRVKLGEIWQLGRHRIACGDSTDEGNVRKLLGGKKIQIVFSDPPYGVDYDGGTTKREKLENDHTGTDIYEKFFASIRSSLDPKCPFYIWYAEPISVPVLTAIEKNKLQIRSIIVWNKNLAQFGALSAQYKQKHEPCLYMHFKGQAPYWFGPTNEITVWDIDRESANKLHPTQKPTDLAERALANSSDSNAIVFDGFLGSGSTLIAAQKMPGNRTVYGFELSPDYCEVIIRRWEEFTGGVAELAGHL